MSSGTKTINRLRPGLRTRLIVLFVFIFGTTLVGFTYFLYRAFVANHQREFDVALLNYTVDLAHSLEVDLFGEVALRRNLLVEKEKIFPFSLGHTVIEIWSIDGKAIARSRNLGRAHLPLSTQELLYLPERKSFFKNISPAEAADLGLPREQHRLLTYFIEKPEGDDYALQVGAPMVLLESEQNGLIAFILFSIPFVLFVAAVGGYTISKRALAPVEAIIRKAREITARDLSKRVPEPASDDELRTLARTLNALLDRLQRAFQGQEAFLADASHQLKTPLAILRGEIDLMQSQPRSPGEVKEFFESASQEVDYLSRVVDDLLLLARIEAGADHLSFEAVRLDETVLEVCSRLGKLAERKQVRLAPRFSQDGGGDSGFEVEGDPDLLRVLLENLVQNAVKYSPEENSVLILLEGDGKMLQVTVEDHGPGIAASDRPRIFERFYRGPQTSDGKKGYGLGLAIVKKVVEVHGGTVNLESHSAPEAGTGTRFIIRLPRRRGMAT